MPKAPPCTKTTEAQNQSSGRTCAWPSLQGEPPESGRPPRRTVPAPGLAPPSTRGRPCPGREPVLSEAHVSTACASRRLCLPGARRHTPGSRLMQTPLVLPWFPRRLPLLRSSLGIAATNPASSPDQEPRHCLARGSPFSAGRLLLPAQRPRVGFRALPALCTAFPLTNPTAGRAQWLGTPEPSGDRACALPSAPEAGQLPLPLPRPPPRVPIPPAQHSPAEHPGPGHRSQ